MVQSQHQADPVDYNTVDAPGFGAALRGIGLDILQGPADKPHGLRGVYILCDNGYAWVASRPL